MEAVSVVAKREHPARLRAQALPKDTRQALPLDGVLQIGFEGIDVGGEASLAPQIVPDVFVGGHEPVSTHPQGVRQGLDETPRILRGAAGRIACQSEPGLITPDRLPIHSPHDRNRPAWQLFPWIPFALTM